MQIQPRGKIVCLRVASSTPPTRQIHLSPQRCSSCFPYISHRQIHLSPNVVQVVSLCPSCFSTSPKVVQVVPVVQVVFPIFTKTDLSVSQRCSSCFFLSKSLFNFSPRQIHLSDIVVQVVPVVQVVFPIFPTDRFICLKVVL